MRLEEQMIIHEFGGIDELENARNETPRGLQYAKMTSRTVTTYKPFRGGWRQGATYLGLLGKSIKLGQGAAVLKEEDEEW